MTEAITFWPLSQCSRIVGFFKHKWPCVSPRVPTLLLRGGLSPALLCLGFGWISSMDMLIGSQLEPWVALSSLSPTLQFQQPGPPQCQPCPPNLPASGLCAEPFPVLRPASSCPAVNRAIVDSFVFLPSGVTSLNYLLLNTWKQLFLCFFIFIF